jgi:hypothetical protein
MKSLLFLLLFASQAMAQTEIGWDQGLSRSRIFVVEADDHFADVCFENRISSGYYIHTKKLVFKDVEIMVTLEHTTPAEIPDTVIVNPPIGFIAIPETIIVNEFETGCVRIEEQLLG